MSFWSANFAAAAAAYAFVAVALVTRGARSWHSYVFAAALSATSLWALLQGFSPAHWQPAIAATLRDACWFALVLGLIHTQAPQATLWRRLAGAAAVLITADLAAITLPAEGIAIAGLRLNEALPRMAVSALGLLLVENLLRNASRERFWNFKLLGIGLGVVFSFNLIAEIPPLFMKAADGNLLLAQPLIYLLVSPLFVVTAIRLPSVGLKVHSSRKVVFHSATLLCASVVMEGMAFAALFVRRFGGTEGTVLEVVFLFAAVVAALTAASSASLRSRLRHFINENFFSYKYDYRVEWSKFIQSLSSRDDDRGSLRVLRTLADLLDCPGGLLLAPRGRRFLPIASWPGTDDGADLGPEPVLLEPFADENLCFLETAAGDPHAQEWLARYPFAWLVVPLRYRGTLAGLAVLNAPRAGRRLDWEDRHLISLTAQQLAVYLVQDEITNALADARQLEEFNRRVAFVVHDMKSSIGQLTLLAHNAERFGDHVQFRKDMVETIHRCADQLRELMARLKGSAVSPAQLTRLDLRDLLADFVKSKAPLSICLRNMPYSPVLTEVDRTALLNVLDHVVTNAVEAAPDHPVELSLNSAGNTVRICVQDRGAGMTSVFLRNELFRPFHSTKSHGFGIGAFQARETMRDLKGDLEICSTVGGGTTVQLVLPQPGASL